MAEIITTRTFNGSGYIFVRKHTDDNAYPTVADMNNMTAEEAKAIDKYVRDLAVAENELGFLKDGISITETITMLEDQDDMGRQKVSDIQSETGSASFALFSARKDTIERMHPLAKTAENEEEGIRLTNIGGIPNKDDSNYDIAFVKPDTKFGDICVYTLGKNISGLTLNFKPGQVSPLNCNYAAQAIDDTGVLYKMSEHKAGKPIYTPGKAASEASAASADTEEQST